MQVPQIVLYLRKCNYLLFSYMLLLCGCTNGTKGNVSCEFKRNLNLKKTPGVCLFDLTLLLPLLSSSAASTFSWHPSRAKQNIEGGGQLECRPRLREMQFFFFTELVRFWLEGSRKNVIFRKLQLGNKMEYKCCRATFTQCSEFTSQSTRQKFHLLET